MPAKSVNSAAKMTIAYLCVKVKSEKIKVKREKRKVKSYGIRFADEFKSAALRAAQAVDKVSTA